MWNHRTAYMTIKEIKEMQDEYTKSVRKYERQRKYEKHIVCSVPETTEQNTGVIVPTTDRVEPG